MKAREPLGPIQFRWDQTGTKTTSFTALFQLISDARTTEIIEEFGAGDGNRTNTIDQNKALLPVSQFNWSQIGAKRSLSGLVPFEVGKYGSRGDTIH